MLEMPLRVGIGGAGEIAEGVASQISATDGMDLAWQSEISADELKERIEKEPIDVFVEAAEDLTEAVETSLAAISGNAHLVLTNPEVDTSFGLLLQNEAYQQGIVITSDAGTPHATLASMIQEAHIMGFDVVQAGQASPNIASPLFQYQMAALANGFGFLPPDGGMTGPEVDCLEDALSIFDLDSYGDTPRVDFVTGPKPGLYLIVKPKNTLSQSQQEHLSNCHFGTGPYYLFRRDFPLGYFETPKSIFNASAGQALLTPAFSSCQVYGEAKEALNQSDLPTKLEAKLHPFEDDLIPLSLLNKATSLKADLDQNHLLQFDDLELPDSALLRHSLKQRELISASLNPS